MAASGALTSALRLVTKATFEKYKNGLCHGTMLFLAISTCFEFICVILYAFYFPKLPIVKYYRSKAALEGSTLSHLTLQLLLAFIVQKCSVTVMFVILLLRARTGRCLVERIVMLWTLKHGRSKGD